MEPVLEHDEMLNTLISNLEKLTERWEKAAAGGAQLFPVFPPVHRGYAALQTCPAGWETPNPTAFAQQRVRPVSRLGFILSPLKLLPCQHHKTTFHDLKGV